MLKLSFRVALLSVLFFVSCNEKVNEEKEIESLKTEVIGIHDEVMPKMDKIMQLKAQLEEDVIEINDSTSSDSLIIVRNLINDLEEADAAMMGWMRNYDPMMENMSNEQKLTYLESEKKDIQLVRQQMLSAISQSEKYLED